MNKHSFQVTCQRVSYPQMWLRPNLALNWPDANMRPHPFRGNLVRHARKSNDLLCNEGMTQICLHGHLKSRVPELVLKKNTQTQTNKPSTGYHFQWYFSCLSFVALCLISIISLVGKSSPTKTLLKWMKTKGMSFPGSVHFKIDPTWHCLTSCQGTTWLQELWSAKCREEKPQ